MQIVAGLVGLTKPLQHRGSIGKEGHPEIMMPTGHPEPGLQMGIDPFIVFVLGRPHGELRHDLTIQKDLQFMVSIHPFNLLIPVPLKPHLNLVISRLGKDPRNQHPSSGSQRKTRHLVFLSDVRPDPHSRDLGFRGGADSEPGYFLGRCEIAVQQSGREIPHRDIVEAVAGLICRQQFRRIKIHRKEIADRILVLDPGQAAQCQGPSRMGMAFRQVVQ